MKSRLRLCIGRVQPLGSIAHMPHDREDTGRYARGGFVWPDRLTCQRLIMPMVARSRSCSRVLGEMSRAAQS